MAGIEFHLREYDSLGSTNDEAKRLAEDGAREGTVIRADRQSQGRGRRGRQWVSETGNLFTSILLRPEVPLHQAATLPFVAAVALGDTLAPKLPQGAVSYKWPNDVLLKGRKVSGILIESGGSRLGFWLVLGLGLNLSSYPGEALYPATSLKEAGVEWTPQEALNSFLPVFAGLYDTWRGHGFAPLRRAWLNRAAHIGKAVEVRQDGRALNGVFEDIDENGALRLRLADGELETITAGDVFFNE